MSIVHREVAEGLWQLSSDNFPLSVEPGPASRNAYLVCGSQRALLFDLSLEEEGLFAYASRLAELPVQLVLSHAHVDHIYHLSEQPEVWLHPDDVGLLRRGSIFQKPVRPCPRLHFLRDGEIIDLGDRELTVFHIPGHTDGSILLWDAQTGTLLSGDTVARRLLFGLHGFVPFPDFCRSIGQLKRLPIRQIYSAHDRCALPPEHIDFMIEELTEDIHKAKSVRIPFLGRYLSLTEGNETDIQHLNLAALVRKPKSYRLRQKE